MRFPRLTSITLQVVVACAFAGSAAAQSAGASRTRVPLRFARGTTEARALVSLAPGELAREYVLHARAGQTMSVSLADRQGPGAVSVGCPGCAGAGAAFRAFSTGGRWSGVLPATGSYVLRVAAAAPGTSMSLAVSLTGGKPTPVESTPRTTSEQGEVRPRRPEPEAPVRKPAAEPSRAGTHVVLDSLSPAARRAAQLGAAAAQASVAAPFRAMLPGLKRATGVPVLLPRQLPGEMEQPLYAFGRGTASGYTITIAHAPGCDAHACNAGYMTAARGRRPAGTRRTLLANGAEAFFTPMACGASCTAPRLEWARAGVTYGVELSLPGSDAHHLAVLTRVAQSALAAGSR